MQYLRHRPTDHSTLLPDLIRQLIDINCTANKAKFLKLIQDLGVETARAPRGWNLYAFLQKRPESAEMIAAIAGTRKAWKETLQTSKMFLFDVPTGNKSLREVEEFCIHPNIIKSLTVGKCVCIKKYPTSRAYLVKVNK